MITFIVLIIIYIVYAEVKSPDIWFLYGSILVLLYTTICICHKQSKNIEMFEEQDSTSSGRLLSEEISISDILTNNKKIDLEEDISKISINLKRYYTVFNSVSYPSFGKTWINIAPVKNEKDCDESGRDLQFDIAPVFTRRYGHLLGSNRLIGPHSNSLGIQFNRPFTLILVVRHGNIDTSVDREKDIELIKLYANSPNNNGISLYIKRNSVEQVDTIQRGKLLLQYADKYPLECVVNQSDNGIIFQKETLSFYFITKEVDYLRVMYMSDRNTSVNELCRMPMTTEDITFSNKEMVINRNANWYANIFTFGVYNAAFTDEDALYFHTYYTLHYTRNVDAGYINMTNKYNEAIRALETLSKCPFDKDTCHTCSMVSDWTNINNIIKSPMTCKSAINEFCKNNQTHSYCTCWDVKQLVYNTSTCQQFRGLFSDDNACLENLTEEDLKYIKSKYKLLSPDECPKEVKPVKPRKNKYQDYDYNRLKVRLHDSIDTNTSALDDPILPNVTVQTTQQKHGTIVSTTKANDIEESDTTKAEEVLDKIIQTKENVVSASSRHIVTKNEITDDIPQKIEGPNQGFFNSFMRVVGLGSR